MTSFAVASPAQDRRPQRFALIRVREEARHYLEPSVG